MNHSHTDEVRRDMEPTPSIYDPILDEIAERLDDRNIMADTPNVYAEIDAEIHGLCTAIDLLTNSADTYDRLIIEGEIVGRVTASQREAIAGVRDFLSGRKPHLFAIK